MNDGDNTSKIYGNALLGGSNIIWDKNDAFQGEKFGPKFEYLEIDEFLNENGLNESDVEFLDHLQKSEVNNNDTSTNSSTNNPANTGSTKATSSPNTTSSSTTSAQLNNLLTLSTSLSSVNSISSSSSTTSPSSSNSSTLDSSSSSSSSRPSSSSISLNQTVSSTSLTAPSSFLSNNTTQPIRNSNANPATAPNSLIRPACEPTLSFSNINKALPPVKPKDSNLNENLISSTSSNGSPRASTSSRLNSFDWSVNDDAEDGDELEDLEEYATRMRKFSSDDLKMQPTLKKSKKQFVPNELKDDKYWARRRKNNMAAKRSRDARRMKENQIAITASYLERENELLRKQLEDSRRETKLLKAKLARYESMLPMDGPK